MQTMTVDTIYQQYIEPLSQKELWQLMEKIRQHLIVDTTNYTDEHEKIFDTLRHAHTPELIQQLVQKNPQLADSDFLTTIEGLIKRHIPLDAQSELINALRWQVLVYIDKRIKKAMDEIEHCQEKYHLTYSVFQELIVTDEAFLDQLEDNHPLWEMDLGRWEYYSEELTTWRNYQKNI
ncbi:hypothetical protein QUF58_01420 [Anaerolineales bacterium HSG24]|nr:hypothetical protein [Anaerolineales bacterium HSG24]